MLARLRSAARMIFGRSRWEQDLRDELQFHVDERASDLAGKGLQRPEALRRARLEFGSVERYKEGVREARGARWIDESIRNLTYAVRSIRRNPGFTAVAVLSLALGIGANLAVFGVLYRLLLTKLPVQDPDRLYQITLVRTDRTAYGVPFPQFEVMRASFDMFKPLFGSTVSPPREVTAGERTDLVRVGGVTGNYFEALGIEPAHGRLLTSADEQGRASEIAVISHRLWQTAFAGAASAVGQTIKIQIASQPGAYASYVVVGVAPPEFNGTARGAPPALYLPLHGYERI